MKAARIAAVQANIRHLATSDNVARHLDLIDEAKSRGASLVLFPELSTTGHNGSPDVVRDAEPADGRIYATIARRAPSPTHPSKRITSVPCSFANVLSACGWCSTTAERSDVR